MNYEVKPSTNRLSVLKEAIKAEGWELIEFLEPTEDTDASFIVRVNGKLWDIQVAEDGLVLYDVLNCLTHANWFQMTFPQLKSVVYAHSN